MKPADNINKFFKNAVVNTNPKMDEAVLDKVLTAHEKAKNTKSAFAEPNLWRQILKSPIAKLAAAAVITMAVVLSINVWDKTTPAAYALEQTVEAHHSLRSIHIKDFDFSTKEEVPREFWISCDERGGIESVRCYMPAWDSPQDGPKSIVWKQGVAKTWLHKKNSFVMVRDESISQWVSELIQRVDPICVIERLQESEKQGKLTLQIEKPADRHKPILVTASYLSNGSPTGLQDILYVDQATKRVLAINSCRLEEDGRWVCKKRLEYHDYDVPISSDLFAIEKEVPADATRIDKVTQDVGLAQGNMSDEEAVKEVIRQFFEALKARDYNKAGLLQGGFAARNMEDEYGALKVVRVISIGQPQPHPRPGRGFLVTCEVELENNDGTTRVESYPRCTVRLVDARMYPARWYIYGGL
jgi:hypothetical protein